MRRLLLWLLLFCASGADAAVVYLKDGGTLEGVLVSSSTESVILRTSAGLVTVGMIRVARVEDVPPPAPQGQTQLKPWERKPPQNLLTLALGLAAPLSHVSLAPVGGESSNGDIGFLGGVQYFHSVSPRLSLGGGFEYFYRSGTDSLSLLPSAAASAFGDTFTLLGLARYALMTEGAIRPYLLAGLGAAHSTLKIDAAPLVGFVWSDTNTFEVRRLIDGDAWSPATTLRLGFDFLTYGASVFSLEGGWHWSAPARYPATGQGKSLGLNDVNAPLSALVFAARWGWRF